MLLAPGDGALAVLLGMEPGLSVVAQVGGGEDLQGVAVLACPDVALVDDVGSVRALAEAVPECRVLVLATSARPGLVSAALAAGAAGVVLRDGPVPDLTTAIHRALTGETTVDPALSPPAGP